MEGNSLRIEIKDNQAILSDLGGLLCPFCKEWPLELKLNKETDIHLDGPGFSVGCAGSGQTDCPNITHSLPNPEEAIGSAMDTLEYFQKIDETRLNFS